jgi:SAM-dependent MidA family methyltransferase
VSNTLPIPNSEAKQLSDKLFLYVQSEIKKTGGISFARYMELALYTPQLGYYQNTLKKFGKEGDFVTAPEISPLFSYCLANQCAEILAAMGGGDVLEFGAGSGVMAADILCALKEKNQLPSRYYILELSGFLKSIQRETIQAKMPEFIDCVIWLDQLPKEPIQGVIIANEVLDAMPVSLFTNKSSIKECGVTIENNELVGCVLEKNNAKLIAQLEKYEIHFSENYTSEINLYLSGWIKSVSTILSRGVVLILDYGFPRHEYYHVDRSMGTIMCHYRHYAHSNPLVFPGIQDITAHVDFTAVAESASDNGFSVVGFTNQAAFLMNCGLLSFVKESTDEKKRFLQNQQVLQLTLPSEMGELFKVMGLSKNYDNELLGFQSMNQLMRL